MLKNYPSIYLFLLSLTVALVITFSAPIIGSWNIYCSVIMDVLKFTVRVVFVFFLCCAIIEAAHSLFFRNHHH
ncbi:hypothetical protein [Pelosinus sp. sgz500959]|uniref:hypothetical protein n=1 Tax=Pelosinus sp. sgz500959 TaxID=3242472 RepID=UPI003671293A